MSTATLPHNSGILSSNQYQFSQVSRPTRTSPTHLSSPPVVPRLAGRNEMLTAPSTGTPARSTSRNSRSAPTSPVARASISSGGLSPLSSIQLIALPPSERPYERQKPHPLPSHVPEQIPPLVPSSLPSGSGPRPTSESVPSSPSLPSRLNQAPPQSRPSTLSNFSQTHPNLPVPPHIRELRATQSRSAANVASSDSDETEYDFDSDTTFKPNLGRGRSESNSTVVRHKQSRSQPDLTALRNEVEGWAGVVARGLEDTRVPLHVKGKARVVQRSRSQRSSGTTGSDKSTLGQKTPPAGLSLPLVSTKSPGSKSHPLLVNLNGSSPQLPLTPVDLLRRQSQPETYSEDGDDDYDGISSPSSGSLSFSPRKNRDISRLRPPSSLAGESDISIGLRRRDRGLGLSLGLTPSDENLLAQREAPRPPRFVQWWIFAQAALLRQLPILAIGPAAWSFCVLLAALLQGKVGQDVWPWGVDLSPEALETLVQGGGLNEGDLMDVDRGDMALCVAWVSTTVLQTKTALMI